MRAPFKVHLVFHGVAACRSKIRQGGRLELGVTTRGEFSALAPETRCGKCAAIVARLPEHNGVATVWITSRFSNE